VSSLDFLVPKVLESSIPLSDLLLPNLVEFNPLVTKTLMAILMKSNLL
jgi:hypothetical protein